MGGVLELSAYLVREASGLDDSESVVLTIGAESVRKLALDALRERDGLREELDRAKKVSDHHVQWWAIRHRRLWSWAHDELNEEDDAEIVTGPGKR